MKPVIDLGLPELTTEQIETLCSTAENAARKYVLMKASSKMIDRLDISVEATGPKPVDVTVEIDLELTSSAEGINANELVKEAINKAYKVSENYLRKIK